MEIRTWRRSVLRPRKWPRLLLLFQRGASLSISGAERAETLSVLLQWYMFGIAACLFAPAFLRSELKGHWSPAMGILSLVAGVGALAFAVVQAQQGFTETSMAFQSGLYLGVVWILSVGLFLLRSPVVRR